MKIVRCPTIRPKKIQGVLQSEAVCGHILGFFDENASEQVLQCKGCRCFYRIKKDKDWSIESVEKASLNFNEEKKDISVVSRKIIL